MTGTDLGAFDYAVDLEAEAVLFRDGFSVPIVSMFDEDGEHTFEIDEVVAVYFRMPPDGNTYGVLLEDLETADELNH